MAKNSETTARVAPLAVSILQACDASGLSRSAIYDAIGSGALKAGRRTLILREDLRAFLAALPTMNTAA